jgi:hypothetical protein
MEERRAWFSPALRSFDRGSQQPNTDSTARVRPIKVSAALQAFARPWPWT